MKFKVLNQDDHRFHVQHPDGSKFFIAKKGLSPKVLEKIQHFAGGGPVDFGLSDADKQMVGSYMDNPQRQAQIAAITRPPTPEELDMYGGAAMGIGSIEDQAGKGVNELLGLVKSRGNVSDASEAFAKRAAQAAPQEASAGKATVSALHGEPPRGGRKLLKTEQQYEDLLKQLKAADAMPQPDHGEIDTITDLMHELMPHARKEYDQLFDQIVHAEESGNTRLANKLGQKMDQLSAKYPHVNFSKGGVVPAQPTQSYGVDDEDEDAFHVAHPDGSKFRVAKKGLSKKVLAEIEAMKKPVHAYNGVLAQDPGGSYVDSAMQSLGVDPSAQPSPAAAQPSAPAAPERLSYFDALKQLGGDAVYGLGKVAEPFVAPLTTGSGAGGQQAYDASLRSLTGKGAPSAQAPAAPAPQATSDVLTPDEALKRAQMLAQSPQAGQIPGAPQLGDINRIIGMGEAGVNQEAKALGVKSKAEAGAYGQYQQDIAALQERTNQQLADNEHEADQLRENIQNNKIDPGRLWHNASVGNRVMGTIGLILGGMAGQGKTNPAMDVLQKAIDRDIDSQKQDLDNNKTLLNFNFKKYGDIRTAEAATRMQLASILQGSIGKAAASAGSDVAQAHAKQAIMQLELAKVPYKQQLAQRQVLAQSYQGVPANGAADQYLLQSDPKYAAQRVNVEGRIYRHTGDVKAANEMRTFESRLAPIENSVKELSALGPSATVNGTPAWQRAQSIRAGLGTAIAGLKSTMIGSTRINEQEVNAALQQISDPTRINQLLSGQLRNDEFLKELHGSADEMRRQNLIGYRGMGDVQGRQKGFK